MTTQNNQNQQQAQQPQNVETSTGLWWKIPATLAVVGGLAYGAYVLLTGNVEEAVGDIAE